MAGKTEKWWLVIVVYMAVRLVMVLVMKMADGCDDDNTEVKISLFRSTGTGTSFLLTSACPIILFLLSHYTLSYCNFDVSSSTFRAKAVRKRS